MTKKKQNIKEYYKIADVKNPWQFLMWLVGTKEFARFLAILLLAFLILFLSQSFKFSNKYFQYDPVIKKIEIER